MKWINPIYVVCYYVCLQTYHEIPETERNAVIDTALFWSVSIIIYGLSLMILPINDAQMRCCIAIPVFKRVALRPMFWNTETGQVITRVTKQDMFPFVVHS